MLPSYSRGVTRTPVGTGRIVRSISGTHSPSSRSFASSIENCPFDSGGLRRGSLEHLEHFIRFRRAAAAFRICRGERTSGLASFGSLPRPTQEFRRTYCPHASNTRHRLTIRYRVPTLPALPSPRRPGPGDVQTAIVTGRVYSHWCHAREDRRDVNSEPRGRRRRASCPRHPRKACHRGAPTTLSRCPPASSSGTPRAHHEGADHRAPPRSTSRWSHFDGAQNPAADGDV